MKHLVVVLLLCLSTSAICATDEQYVTRDRESFLRLGNQSYYNTIVLYGDGVMRGFNPMAIGPKTISLGAEYLTSWEMCEFARHMDALHETGGVVFYTGLEDLRIRLDAISYRNQLKCIIENIPAPKIIVGLHQTLNDNMNVRINRFNGVAADMCRRYSNCRFVPSTLGNSYPFMDGPYPTEPGYREWAKRIKEKALELGMPLQ